MTVTLTDLGAALGISKMSVSRGKHRLVKTLLRDAKGKTLGVSDLQEAIAEWNANGDYTDAPQRAPAVPVLVVSAPKPTEQRPAIESKEASVLEEVSMAEASARSKHWEAEMRELKYKEAAGELVPRADVEREWISVLSSLRTKLLGVPSRIKGAIPELTVKQVTLITATVREALTDICDDEAAT